jgi:hypothetical protein
MHRCKAVDNFILSKDKTLAAFEDSANEVPKSLTNMLLFFVGAYVLYRYKHHLPALGSTQPQFFDYPEAGDYVLEHLHHSQAVRLGNETRVAGQGKSMHAAHLHFLLQPLTCDLQVVTIVMGPYLSLLMTRSRRRSGTSSWRSSLSVLKIKLWTKSSAFVLTISI